MDKKKQTFIESLLTNKKLKPGQRERVLALAARELSRDGESSLTPRVERIEEVVFAKSKNRKSNVKEKGLENQAVPQSNSVGEINKDLPPYSDPSILSKFLFDFNQNSILRSACHDIDLDELGKIKEYCGTGNKYDYKIHQQKIVHEFELLHRQMKKAPSYKFIALIRGYLTGKWKIDPKFKKNGWSTDRIDYHWLHQSVLEWVENNRDWPPHLSEGITLDQGVIGPEIERFTSKTTGENITYFRDLVLHFKNLFHFRDDNSIYEIVNHANHSESRWKDNVVFEFAENSFPRNIELFTDVDKFKQAYKKIIGIIISVQRRRDSNIRPVIRLSLREGDDNSVTFSILHKESVYMKSVQSMLGRSFGTDYTNLINKQVNGLCELYLNADFGNNEYARINIWNGMKLRKVDISPIEGVEHELKFIKK